MVSSVYAIYVVNSYVCELLMGKVEANYICNSASWAWHVVRWFCAIYPEPTHVFILGPSLPNLKRNDNLRVTVQHHTIIETGRNIVVAHKPRRQRKLVSSPFHFPYW